ncbi:MAG TPA: efflux RND transporter periplasmic adaptor subunit [Myxococcota bacterium]|nr:efflux RND transporter periplasmic adaptor subunit [Myxococcota bacterium]
MHVGQRRSGYLRRGLALLGLLGLLGLGVWFVRGSIGGSSGPTTELQGAGLRIRVASKPGVVRTGRNELQFEVNDLDGVPIDDAEISLRDAMTMPGTADMVGQAHAERTAPGRYRAEINLEMSGTWRLGVDVKRPPPGVALHAEGSLTTGGAGVRLTTGGEGAPGDTISHYTCPMHPSVHESQPGKCPICGMDLVAVTKEDAASGAVRIDSARRQRIGIRIAPVERTRFERVVRAVGRVAYDETGLVDVSLKTRGWVRDLRANALGAPVRKGEPLFSVYSPELYAAQAEYLQALRSTEAGTEAGLGRGDGLLRAARTRLRLWNVSDPEIDALGRRGTPLEALPILAPASGYIIEKNIVEGGTIEAGMRLFRIAPLDRVWIDAQLYEADLKVAAVGQTAKVSLPSLPGSTLEAKVAYIYPSLDGDTRTGRVRLVLANPGLQLRPDMYADIELHVDRGEETVVPVSAVIYAGGRRIVFIDHGDGRLSPREIQIGLGNGTYYEVVSGLEVGEQVVVSGNFLVAAESRLASAFEQW